MLERCKHQRIDKADICTPVAISLTWSLKLGGVAKCFKSMNEIKDNRKCMVVLKILENIEGAFASFAPSKLHLWVDLRTANCLVEVVRSITAMQSRCRSSCDDVTFRPALAVFRVVRDSSVHCFRIRITKQLFCSTWTAIVRLENPPSRSPITLPRSNSVSCWNFSFFRRGGMLMSH